MANEQIIQTSVRNEKSSLIKDSYYSLLQTYLQWPYGKLYHKVLSQSLADSTCFWNPLLFVVSFIEMYRIFLYFYTGCQSNENVKDITWT